MISNDSNQTILIIFNGEEIGRVRPGDSVGLGVLPFDGRDVYQVRSLDGALLEELDFSWNEINDADGFVIKISDEDFPP